MAGYSFTKKYINYALEERLVKRIKKLCMGKNTVKMQVLE